MSIHDNSEPPPGPDELRAIVARSGRHHRRAAAAGMAATLAVGAAAGYLITGRSHPAATTVAATGSPPTTSGPISGSVSGSFNVGGPLGGTSTFGSSSRFTSLFTRTARRVAIRGFLTNYPQIQGVPARPAGCLPPGPPSFQAELSTEKMVGTADAFGALDRSKPVSAVTTTVVGQVEGDPTAAVVAATGPGVAKVRVSFTGGATDDMTPAQGWVTLAAGAAGDPVSPTTPIGTLTALSASGKVLASQPLTPGSGMAKPFSAPCGPLCPPMTTTTTAPPSGGPTGIAPTAPPTTGVPKGLPAAPPAMSTCAIVPNWQKGQVAPGTVQPAPTINRPHSATTVPAG